MYGKYEAAGGEEEGARGHRPRRLVRLPWSRSPSLPLLLPSPLAFPAVSSSLPSLPRSVAGAQSRTPLATQLRTVPRTNAVIRGINHAGITRAIYAIHASVSPFIARGETSLSVVRCPSQGHSSECHSRGTAIAATQYSRTSVRCTR